MRIGGTRIYRSIPRSATNTLAAYMFALRSRMAHLIIDKQSRTAYTYTHPPKHQVSRGGLFFNISDSPVTPRTLSGERNRIIRASGFITAVCYYIL